MTTEQLKALRAAANEVCALISEQAERWDEPINWAYLHCMQSEWCTNDAGEEYPKVYVSEADAGCPRLQNAISKELDMRGYKDVAVVTEW